ncbi:unnamed protein product [Ectocarpus sp. 12 AP-2014]
MELEEHCAMFECDFLAARVCKWTHQLAFTAPHRCSRWRVVFVVCGYWIEFRPGMFFAMI